MNAKAASTLCLLAGLAACGGGSGSVDDHAVLVTQPFLLWTGNASGDVVVDGNDDAFAFHADSGCLHNFQTGRENTAFCLVPGSNIVTYGPFRGQVLNVRSSAGTCIAAVIDAFTGNFADIEVDAFGRELVLTTQLRPILCPL